MSARRSGFTLIELLVVIAILGVLLALTVAGVFTANEGQRQANTEAAMRAVHKTLTGHWNAIIADAKNEVPSASAFALAGGNNEIERAKVIWVKLRLIEAFPTKYDDINNPLVYQLPALAGATEPYIPSGQRKNIASYQRALNGRVKANDPLTESSACLVLALSQNRGGFKLDVDGLGAATVKDTDGDGMMEIADGWMTALAFFRFPTGNPEMNQFGPPQGSLDPLDPKGTLLHSGWLASPLKAEFKRVIHPIVGPRSAYIAPVLVSAARNQKFGLDNTMAINPPGNADEQDNIYSFRLRLGARGD